MRLDPETGATVIAAALAEGAVLLDTANVYFADGGKLGDNERLVAEAISAWNGDRERLTVATKGGMTRIGKRWIPDGRARSLRKACEASAVRLGGPIDLYLLHAVDPKVSIETSVRALAELREAGTAKRIGLCNIGYSQLDAALAVAPIDAVQVAVNPHDISAIRGGLAERCRERGIELIAHSPFGGVKRAARLAKHAIFAREADRLGVSVHELILAWLADLNAPLTAIPGATRIESARSAVRGQKFALDEEARALLDRELEAGPLLSTPRSERRPSPGNGDVVVLMGSPGAGKTSVASELTEKGYLRLNRDDRGGTLAGLIEPLEAALEAGTRQIVLDNTYPTRSSRNQVIEAAWRRGAHARCIHLETSMEDAQINAVTRMIRAGGGALPSPELTKAKRRKGGGVLGERRSPPKTISGGLYPPNVLFRFRRELEEPAEDEGFESVERRPFERRERANPKAKALILEVDGVLRQTKSGAPRPLRASDVVAIGGRAKTLREYQSNGWLLLGISWQPEIGAGKLTDEVASECFERLRSLLNIDLEFVYCPHVAGPPRCWCRKPLPGLGVLLSERHRLDVAGSIMVGRNPTDALFAQRLGFDYKDAADFF